MLYKECDEVQLVLKKFLHHQKIALKVTVLWNAWLSDTWQAKAEHEAELASQRKAKEERKAQ